MTPAIYLIEPKVDYPNYHSADVFASMGYRPTAYMGSLPLATVAALIPADFEITLCDEQITPVDMNTSAKFIGLTGKSGQVNRLKELAQHFRERGKVVLIGGPYASLVPEDMRPYCDILVRGEIETIAPQLFADLRAGTWQSEYVGGQPTLENPPIPRWDLYPNDRAMSGCLQTARGCPFECEFCDVIVYAGRKQRHKPVDKILAELEVLSQHGYHHVFIADDNFTVYRRKAKEILIAIRDWNHRQPNGSLTFSTQLSIDIAKDDEMLQLCAEAGLRYVFIGIETPNEESLRQAKKRQNVGIDLVDQISNFLRHGIAVMGGMIVGFDGDGPDIFERQLQFAMTTPVPFYSLGALVAPHATPLYHRLAKANRLVPETFHQDYGAGLPPWMTNIIPQQLTQEELLTGIQWLANRLYDPEAFCTRLLNFVEAYQEPPLHLQQAHLLRKPRKVDIDLIKVGTRTYKACNKKTNLFTEVIRKAQAKPSTLPLIATMMLQYAQVRHMYEHGQFWEPYLAEQPAPIFEQHPALTLAT